mgnify:CR=1 FL=1
MKIVRCFELVPSQFAFFSQQFVFKFWFVVIFVVIEYFVVTYWTLEGSAS